MTGQRPRREPAGYRLRVDGHLDQHWAAVFDDLTLTRHDDGTTSLSGRVADQAQLHGLLTKVRDLGVTLISVEPTGLVLGSSWAPSAGPDEAVQRPAVRAFAGSASRGDETKDPDHHKASAWRERRRLQLLTRDLVLDTPSTSEAHAAALARPLTISTASLTRVVEGLRAQILTLTGDLHVALDDLRVVGDPDAAKHRGTARQQHC